MQILDTSLDKGMAICAEQNALFSLGSHAGNASAVTLPAEWELLFLGIEMVELQGGGMLVKTAQTTSATRLFDQLTLDLPSPPRHGCRITPGTAKATLPTRVEQGLAMPRTHHGCPP